MSLFSSKQNSCIIARIWIKYCPKAENVALCASYLEVWQNILKIHKIGIDSIIRLLSFFFFLHAVFFVCLFFLIIKVADQRRKKKKGTRQSESVKCFGIFATKAKTRTERLTNKVQNRHIWIKNRQ